MINAGGGPALYFPPDLLAVQKKIGFSQEVKPFVNIVRPPRLAGPALKPYDWLHEREWRFPGDIVFDDLTPEAVVLPDGRGRFWNFKSPKKVIAMARKFKELRRSRGSGA